MDILKKLRNAAQERNFSIAQLEKLAEFSNGSIGKWATSVPKVDSLYKIAKIMNVPIEYFLSEDDAATIDSFQTVKVLATLPFEEQELIENYRQLDSRGKHKLHALAYDELDRMDAEDTQRAPTSSKESAG